ncbi:SDR family oxidoreductase [Cupriavidus sp. 2KB_3]|uniref:SDR family NAD(P)-dependent oxidoreductase n=1 Tax=Cupriavidus TaxID=106589 RepID=UPI0021CCBD07|nr:SDR family oxidoreductase [Cupriavidus campinensis]
MKGAYLMAQEAARRMVQRGEGSIVNIASSSGLRAGGQMSSYGASKAALIHLTQIMALELAGKGVRVNAIAPGNIETDMHAEFAGIEQGILKRIPMRRFGKPSDLDGAMLLLASDAGRYMTGAVIPVDGGQVLSWMQQRFSQYSQYTKTTRRQPCMTRRARRWPAWWAALCLRSRRFASPRRNIPRNRLRSSRHTRQRSVASGTR